jgi:hypothetical protein
MDELSPAIELAIDYGRQLRAIQPDHELLKYLAVGKDPKLDAEFEERFWNKPFPMEDRPGHLVNATIWANYAVALRDTAATPQYLADFLGSELKEMAALDGKAINASTPHCIAEGEEELGLRFNSLPEPLSDVIARFYTLQWLKTNFNGGAVQVRLNKRIIKYVVITDTHYGAMISVKRVS